MQKRFKFLMLLWQAYNGNIPAGLEAVKMLEERLKELKQTTDNAKVEEKRV